MMWTLPTSRPITQDWAAEFDDWDSDGVVDIPGGFYHSLGWNGHNGIDFGCQVGDPVEAVGDGVVEWCGDGNNHHLMSGGGNVIIIRHAGVRSAYLHLSQILVRQGEPVSMGQVIAAAGMSGTVTAPHLHLEFLPLTEPNVNDGWRGRISPTQAGYKPNETTGDEAMAMSHSDRVFVQTVMHEDADRIIRDNRAHTKSAVDTIVKAIGAATFELKKWDHETDNSTGDRVINDLRPRLESVLDIVRGELVIPELEAPANVVDQPAGEQTHGA